MLEIQTPPGCETERAYILGLLFNDWLGLPYRLTQAERDHVCIRLSDDEYVETLWAAMHRLWPRLQRKPRQARTLVSCDVDSPFAFNAWAPQAAAVAAAGHSRSAPIPETSAGQRAGASSFIGGAAGGKAAAQASYRLARGLAADLLKRRSTSLAGRNLLGQWRARRGDHSLDPHRLGLEHIMDLNERAGRAVALSRQSRRCSWMNGRIGYWCIATLIRPWPVPWLPPSSIFRSRTLRPDYV